VDRCTAILAAENVAVTSDRILVHQAPGSPATRLAGEVTVSRIAVSIGLLAAVVTACSSDATTPPSKDARSLPIDGRPQRSVRTATLPVPAPVSTERRFAQLVPEFAGAYRGAGNILVIRVTDLQLSRSGGPAAAQALLQEDLKAHGRGELTISFELAKYDHSRLQSWIDAMVDSLGAYHAASWYIDERTSRIHLGFPDAASQQGLVRAAIKMGVPADAIVAGLDSGSSTAASTLASNVRPIAGGLITQQHQWPHDGFASTGACTFTGVYYQDFYTMFVTAAHCVNVSAHGGDQNWSVYQDTVNHDGYCSSNCIGMVEDNPAFVQQSGNGCPSGQYCRLSDAAAGLPTGSTGGGGVPGQLALPLSGPAALPTIFAPLDISTTSHINLSGVKTDIMVGDTLSKIGRVTGWTKGVVMTKNEARYGLGQVQKCV
jgi:hypothetical protein